MTREEVYEKLNEVFQEEFEDEELTVSDNTTSDDIDDWDSLEHVNLVSAVEEKFGNKFSMAQVREMKNVGDMVDAIMGE